MNTDQIKVDGQHYDYEIQVGDCSALLTLDGGWWTLNPAPGSKQLVTYRRFRATTRIKAIARSLEFLASEVA